MRPLSCSILLAALALSTACTRTPDAGPAAKTDVHASAADSKQDHADESKDHHAKEEPQDHHDKDEHDEHDEHGGTEKAEADTVKLTDQQILQAGIRVEPLHRAFAGAIEAPAVIAANPQSVRVIAVAVGGRITQLRKNLGDPVNRGDVLAVIESAEAAQFKADLEAARRQHELARSTLDRETRLHQEKVSATQDYLAARNGEQEAHIRVRLAEQRLAATGADRGGPLNELMVRSPLRGHVLARSAVLGTVVASDTELFTVADLSEVAVELSISPDDASRVNVGSAVDVATGERRASGRIVSLSRVVDPATRQIKALATLPNKSGIWRIGETVRASVLIPGATGKTTVAVPQSAIQTVEDKPSVFVRTKDGFAVKHLVLGQAGAGYVEVASGLSGDEQLAVSNSYVLKAELGKGEGGEHAH